MISPLNAKLDRKWIEASQRIATLEQQNAELVAALELCKFDSLNMSLEDLGFIRSVVAKVKQP